MPASTCSGECGESGGGGQVASLPCELLEHGEGRSACGCPGLLPPAARVLCAKHVRSSFEIRRKLMPGGVDSAQSRGTGTELSEVPRRLHVPRLRARGRDRVVRRADSSSYPATISSPTQVVTATEKRGPHGSLDFSAAPRERDVRIGAAGWRGPPLGSGHNQHFPRWQTARDGRNLLVRVHLARSAQA